MFGHVLLLLLQIWIFIRSHTIIAILPHPTTCMDQVGFFVRVDKNHTGAADEGKTGGEP